MRTAGDALYRWRDAEGLTQQQAGELFAVTQPAYCDWENGRKVPGEKWRAKIHEVTGGAVPESIWPKPRRRRGVRRVVSKRPELSPSVGMKPTSLSR